MKRPTCACPNRDMDTLSCGKCGVERDMLRDPRGNDIMPGDWRWMAGREPVEVQERVFCVHCGNRVHGQGEVCPLSAVHPTCNYCGKPEHEGRCPRRDYVEAVGDRPTADTNPVRPHHKKVTDTEVIVRAIVVPCGQGEADEESEILEALWSERTFATMNEEEHWAAQSVRNRQIVKQWKAWRKVMS